MAQTIKLKRSATQGAVPSTSDLALGELAVNTYDGKIYIKKDSGSESIVEVGGGSGDNDYVDSLAFSTSTGVLTAGRTGSLSDLTVDLDGRYITGNQTITLSGDVSGSGTTSINVTVADDSHNHIISNVDGLQSALNAKLASSSYTASDVLTKIKTVDGSGSGLDADTVDGIQASSFLRSDTSDTAYGNITFTDNSKAIFGSGSDLQIYHDGNSWIKDTGSGNLVLDTNGNGMFFKHGDETLFEAYADGAVNLRHNNAQKLATISTGIDVTGTATMDGLTVDGNARVSNIGVGGAPNAHGIYVYHTDNFEAALFQTNLGGSLARFTDTTASIEIGVQGGKPVIRTSSAARLTVDGANVQINSGALQMGSTTVIDSSRNLTNIGTLNGGTAWRSNNDGSGSGLDADTLDGQHASAFQASGTYNTIIGTDSDINTSGSTIIDNIYVTDGVITSMGTRTLTLGDLGYTGETNATADQTASEILTAIKTVDGSGSGLDADTVDGIQASAFLRSDTNDTTTGSLTISGSQTRGTYASSSQYHTGADNLVLKGDAYGISSIFFESEKNGTNINHTSDFGFIQFHSYGTGTSGEANELIIGVSNDSDDHVILNAPNANGLKYRIGASATDYTVWHSGNDGSGTGLDADLLDGQQGSYYAAASHVHSYLPLSGGTLTGNVTFQDDNEGITFNGGGRFYKQTGQGLVIRKPSGGQELRFEDNSGTFIGTFWHSGNDGSGTGLDADTVDGVQASSFLRSDADDTLTGNLQINSHVINMNLGNINDNAIDLTSVRSSTWPFEFTTHSVGNDNSSGFWVGSNGYPDMRLRRENSTVRALISSWETSYVSNGFNINGNTAWHAGNDGSGSGLDADTVDGIQASRIVYGDGTLKSSSTSTFHNNVSGFHFYSAATNAPTAAWYNWITCRGNSWGNSDEYSFQLAHSFWSASEFYVRRTQSGTEQGWNKIWTAASDGSGSGLDADLLDGYQTASAPTANTIPIRTANGDIAAREIILSSGLSSNTPTVLVSMYPTTNQLVRTTPAAVAASMGAWTSSNDGSGSGLDADTVDGVHESALMRRSANSQLDMNNNDIIGVDQIIHEGDSDTYMQFHAADQWRVVTGGTERFEVNNSNVTVNEELLLTAGTKAKLLASGQYGHTFMYFRNSTDTSNFGLIYHSGNSMVYGTSSDYRLKENVVPLEGASEKLKLIPVKSFNFIEDPDRTVDGFLAHELQEHIPEAVVGEKDGLDEDGNPEYQAVDQSKLTPLLTAALQEALAKIEELEQRIENLENN